MEKNFLDSYLSNNLLLKDILSCCPFEIFKQFSVIEYLSENNLFLNQGTQYNTVYILLKGELEIFIDSYSGKKIVLDIYKKPGLFIGEQEAILDLPFSSSVRNITPVHLLKLSNATFCEWIKCDNNLASIMLKNQCKQVYNLANKTAYYTLYNAKEQISLSILESHRLDKKITKQEIFRSVSTTSRNINRVLKELIKEDIISIEDSIIHLLNIDKLIIYGGI